MRRKNQCVNSKKREKSFSPDICIFPSSIYFFLNDVNTPYSIIIHISTVENMENDAIKNRYAFVTVNWYLHEITVTNDIKISKMGKRLKETRFKKITDGILIIHLIENRKFSRNVINENISQRSETIKLKNVQNFNHPREKLTMSIF